MTEKTENKKFVTIEVDGKDYPCYQTMGALMLLERETGKRAEQCDTLSDQCVFLWACCKSASRREGVQFDYSVEEFADSITPDVLVAWANAMNEAAQPEKESSEKKD